MLRLSKNNYAGKLIVFEGTDGAGKTTLIELTRQYLSSRFGTENVLIQKQPTDLFRKTRLFQKMMYSADNTEINYRAVQLLTLSDRVQHNSEIIIPALREGKIVICDRYLYTSIVNMQARGYRREKWFFQACREIVKPDCAFLAYIDPNVAIERIRNRPEERERYLNEELLKRVADGFLRQSRRFGLQIVNTNREASEAFAEVKKTLDKITEEKDVKIGFAAHTTDFVRQRL